MDTRSYKTTYLTKDTTKTAWFYVDAGQKSLGRVASEIAKVIRGKNKPGYTPHMNCGDRVVVLNADNLVLTGKKWTQKQYISHSGFPGGQKLLTPTQVKERSSTRIVERAVRGMLPKNRLGRQLFKNLYVYEGSEHPHSAQEPKEMKL